MGPHLQPFIGKWENLLSMTFDIGTLQILLESEEGYVVPIQCKNLLELHALAKFCIVFGEKYSITSNWKIPVLAK